MAAGSWALLEELYASGDAAFVSELRRLHDVERLGKFALRWLADHRPEARHLLLEYLALPFNAFRHEALVKRLFKAAEKAGDDELMGAFLVAFDRSIRHARKVVSRRKWATFATRALAEARVRAWESEGCSQGTVYASAGSFHAYASKLEAVLVSSKKAMPRPRQPLWNKNNLPDASRHNFEKRFILFSLPTRRYLRRRAWRYFRKLGRTGIDRYRHAALAYLKRYTDADVDTEIHLLDNWGLVHTLFSESEALVRPAKGFRFAPGKGLGDLGPAPRFPSAWISFPQALFDLLTQAECRTVRQWSAKMLRMHQANWLSQQSVATCLTLIDHADPDVSALGFELLEKHADLASVPIEAWLTRLAGDDLERLQRLSALLERRLDPARVALVHKVKLAEYRSFPVARLGLTLLRGHEPWSEGDVPTLLHLVNAECATLRPEIVAWLREILTGQGVFLQEWLLEFLDSKFADVRAFGWVWLQESPLKDEPAVWHKLLETPYDDIKWPLVAELTKISSGADPDMIRLLWVSVLLNLHGGGQYKPGVVHQLVNRLAMHGEEAEKLLPLLAIAVRSLRGPEFRAGLVGVVSLFENQPELRPAIAQQVPELLIHG